MDAHYHFHKCNRLFFVRKLISLVIVNVNVTKYVLQKCQICRYQMCSIKL